MDNKTTEPQHDKTKPTDRPVRPARTQISMGIRPVWSETSLCAQWEAKDPRFLRADSEVWSDSGGCPGWSEYLLGARHFVGCVMLLLNYAFQVGPVKNDDFFDLKVHTDPLHIRNLNYQTVSMKVAFTQETFTQNWFTLRNLFKKLVYSQKPFQNWFTLRNLFKKLVYSQKPFQKMHFSPIQNRMATGSER